jgi:hypothetical protein
MVANIINMFHMVYVFKHPHDQTTMFNPPKGVLKEYLIMTMLKLQNIHEMENIN